MATLDPTTQKSVLDLLNRAHFALHDTHSCAEILLFIEQECDLRDMPEHLHGWLTSEISRASERAKNALFELEHELAKPEQAMKFETLIGGEQ